MSNHLVIMAGGVGSRFWPMSTQEKPKQFIDVLGIGKSLLQLTIDRFEDIIMPENIWVVTNKRYVGIVKEQLPQLPESNILCEPCRRNTAPCIAYVSWRIKKKDAKANIVVTPSDHIVMKMLSMNSLWSLKKVKARARCPGLNHFSPASSNGALMAAYSLASAARCFSKTSSFDWKLR